MSVVDEGELAPVALAAARGDVDGSRGGRRGAADLGEELLRHREADPDRVHLLDDDERGVVGLHDVAGVDAEAAGAAGERRADRAVAEIEIRALDGGAIGGHRGGERGGVRAPGFVVFGGDVLLLRQVGVAGGVGGGVVGQRLVACELRLGGVEGCPEGARVDREEQVAAADLLALDEVDLVEDAADLGANLDIAHRLEGADSLPLHGDVGDRGDGGGHRQGGRRRRRGRFRAGRDERERRDEEERCGGARATAAAVVAGSGHEFPREASSSAAATGGSSRPMSCRSWARARNQEARDCTSSARAVARARWAASRSRMLPAPAR